MGLTSIQKITTTVTRLVTFVFTGSILLVAEPVFPSELVPLPWGTSIISLKSSSANQLDDDDWLFLTMNVQSSEFGDYEVELESWDVVTRPFGEEQTACVPTSWMNRQTFTVNEVSVEGESYFVGESSGANLGDKYNVTIRNFDGLHEEFLERTLRVTIVRTNETNSKRDYRIVFESFARIKNKRNLKCQFIAF
jgi:hypothetical protein